jgi:ABC-type multidrug transport system fused ATPase/permease subunit
MLKDTTTIMVAQRISTVLRADKIIVIDRGRIAAEGTHKELMDSSEVYREIYESQLGEGKIFNADGKNRNGAEGVSKNGR